MKNIILDKENKEIAIEGHCIDGSLESAAMDLVIDGFKALFKREKQGKWYKRLDKNQIILKFNKNVGIEIINYYYETLKKLWIHHQPIN